MRARAIGFSSFDCAHRRLGASLRHEPRTTPHRFLQPPVNHEPGAIASALAHERWSLLKRSEATRGLLSKAEMRGHTVTASFA